jgi:nucleoside-diphosphate-sugar epimerase
MRILVLGGTKFLGRAVVEAALDGGHEVTTFTRGITNPDLFPDVERLQGDLTGDVEALRRGRWDVALDMDPTTLPRAVRRYTDALVDAVDHFTFVSTISVYADLTEPIDEDAPVRELDGDEPEEFRDELYGEVKVASERAVEECFAGRALIVRPGLIVGPHDRSDRFTYWVRRIAAGGDVLAPDPPEQPVQLIDVRDLGDFLVRASLAGATGTMNATGPPRPFALGEVLEQIRETVGSGTQLRWVDAATLAAAEVGPWLELPLWLGDRSIWPLLQVDVSRAVGAGLRLRPLEDTIRATHDWDRERDQPLRDGVGLSPERERELLSA